MHKSDSKKMYVTKYLFQINAVLFNFLSINESWQKTQYGFHKNIKHHNYLNNDNIKKKVP